MLGPLSYDEQDQIDAVLERKNGGYIQTFSALDGMLAAIVCTPEMIMPSEYLEIIQEGETEEDYLSFKDEKEAEAFFQLIMRHYNTVLNQIRDFGDVIDGELVLYEPSLLEDENEELIAEDWANGFLTGTHLRPEIWAQFAEDTFEPTDGYTPLFGILALAHENHPDPDLRPLDKPMTNDVRRDFIAGAVLGIKEIYEAFSEQIKADTSIRYGPTTRYGSFVRDTPKIGRNDPCPCGSGKKFKKCCAALKIVH
jgi:uncharacterized protein